MLNQILLGDCYELMKGIPDGSVDLVLTDPPYNTIAADWDKQPIDLVELWKHLKRVLKPKGAVVMTGSQPFTTDLILSNRAWFKYTWVWQKTKAGNFLNANNTPLKLHEDIMVFSSGTTANHSPNRMTYNPQGLKIVKRDWHRPQKYESEHNLSRPSHKLRRVINTEGYPSSVLSFNSVHNPPHPTQKPVELFGYLIRTYTNPGETILDPFAGSGTTAIAAHNTGRNFICMEREEKYWQIANKRLALAQSQLRFDEMVG